MKSAGREAVVNLEARGRTGWDGIRHDTHPRSRPRLPPSAVFLGAAMLQPAVHSTRSFLRIRDLHSNANATDDSSGRKVSQTQGGVSFPLKKEVRVP